MSRVHFLNVGDGDCNIVQHASNRVSVIDICCGNRALRKALEEAAAMDSAERPRGNFNMGDYATNPLEYLETLGIKKIWRFILTHPDMDHMDGLAGLFENFSVSNFWHPGVERDAPDFAYKRYKKEDWDMYRRLATGQAGGVTILSNKSGADFQYATKIEGKPGSAGDALYILAPNAELVQQANDNGDQNDASYVILYGSVGGKILFCGDAHDSTWDHVVSEHSDSLTDIDVMIAPHHGRDSDREYAFLDIAKPRLTLFGNAPSQHLGYNAWHSRKLPFYTNNQAGNVVLEIDERGIGVYIENKAYARAAGKNVLQQNGQGYVFMMHLPKR